jgi:TolA-binding protein
MKKLCVLILGLASAVSAFAQSKTITNADLEKFRQQRVESEKKSKERYAQLGYSSPEVQRQNDQRRAEMEQYSDQLRAQRVQSQNDIIAQANTIRTQLTSINAQINYLRNQGGASNNQSSSYSYGYVPYGYYPPYGYRRNNSALGQISQLPPNMRTTQEYGLMYPGSQGTYNQPLGNIFGGRNRYYRGYVVPYLNGNSGNDVNQQLIILEQQRAGLLAQWEILEDQARRAGIKLD